VSIIKIVFYGNVYQVQKNIFLEGWNSQQLGICFNQVLRQAQDKRDIKM